MGRGLSTAETPVLLQTLNTRIVASIGPRSFNRGNVGKSKVNGLEEVASIGPRSFNRGNPRAWIIVTRRHKSFNWAAVFQPRKPDVRLSASELDAALQLGRGCSTAETAKTYGKAARETQLQLGRGLSTAETCVRPADRMGQSHSFNWAAVFQPRKHGAHRRSDQQPAASIGPRSFNRGNSLRTP